MNQPLIWLHEEALRITHPVFTSAPAGTRAVFIWDDDYLQKLGYSLKRLVFIYETLCELPVDIFYGETVRVVSDLAPSKVYIPSSHKPHLVSLINAFKSVVEVEVSPDEAFAQVAMTAEVKRFFKYWKMAETTALRKNGGLDA
jgi:hypothetical protein